MAETLPLYSGSMFDFCCYYVACSPALRTLYIYNQMVILIFNVNDQPHHIYDKHLHTVDEIVP